MTGTDKSLDEKKNAVAPTDEEQPIDASKDDSKAPDAVDSSSPIAKQDGVPADSQSAAPGSSQSPSDQRDSQTKPEGKGEDAIADSKDGELFAAPVDAQGKGQSSPAAGAQSSDQ